VDAYRPLEPDRLDHARARGTRPARAALLLLAVALVAREVRRARRGRLAPKAGRQLTAIEYALARVREAVSRTPPDRENPPAAAVIEITLGPTLRALLRGEVPPHLVEGFDLDLEVPDFVPEGWAEPQGDEPPG
jgi:hypothetical protein